MRITEPQRTKPQPKPRPRPKPEAKKGHYSSEFWLTIGSLVIVAILVFTGKLDSEHLINLLMVAVPAYGLSRGIAKLKL